MENSTYIRKMASIQEVNGVYPIPGADKICQYGVQGWKIVDQVGKYAEGDLVVFCEVDSFIPNTLCGFLTKPGHTPKVYNGVPGEKLRTIRLKKALSQGLLLPLSVCDNIESELMLGLDVSFPLGIQKWEPPPEFRHADARGNFPQWGKKTDQPRCQNLLSEIQEYYDNNIRFEVSEKADGSSMSVGKYFDDYVVCSRNLSLKLDVDNTYVKVSKKHDLQNKLTGNMLISGELLGPGVQGNAYNIADHGFWVFDIYNPETLSYLPSRERIKICEDLGLNHVPVLHKSATLKELGLRTMDDILKFAEGSSVIGTVNTQREGVVFKSICGQFSFKAVSNLWLINSPSE